jgi:cytochrome c553
VLSFRRKITARKCRSLRHIEEQHDQSEENTRMNFRLCRNITVSAGLAILGIFAATLAAQNQGGTAQNAGAPAQSSIDISHAAGAPQGLPIWAYPVNPPSGRGRGGAAGGAAAATAPPAAAAPAPEDTTLLHVPGSSLGFTKTYIANLFTVPDWFPDAHPPMPDVVAKGNKTDGVQACGYCHLPNGQGRPENQSLTGLPAGYMVQQLSDFKNGLRKSSEPRMGSVSLMVRIGKALNDDDAKAAAAYFSSIKPKPWIRVVESDTVPSAHPAGGLMVRNDGGGTEPIGARIIELAEDQERFELRDPNEGFVAYVPTGSIKKGETLVKTGGGGETMQCTLCHGPDLKGLGNIPSIAGRSPSQMVRQIIDMQTGARNGPQSALMKPVVSKLTNDDIVAITAYLASLAP